MVLSILFERVHFDELQLEGPVLDDERLEVLLVLAHHLSDFVYAFYAVFTAVVGFSETVFYVLNLIVLVSAMRLEGTLGFVLGVIEG